MVILWGEPGTMIYNDGYSVFAGENHPRILGLPVREAWPEVAEFNDNVMRSRARRRHARLQGSSAPARPYRRARRCYG